MAEALSRALMLHVNTLVPSRRADLSTLACTDACLDHVASPSAPSKDGERPNAAVAKSPRLMRSGRVRRHRLTFRR